MDLDEQPQPSKSQDVFQVQVERKDGEEALDLVGGPFAVIESDPGECQCWIYEEVAIT